jgi:DNA-binding response OmpR family regulator
MSINVLLFDRDAVSLAAMRDVLHRAKYHAACAQTFAGAMIAAAQTAPDVAVIDLLTEPATGLDVLRALRQRSDPPVCVVTLRFGHEHRRAEAMGLGAFDCVEQPLTASLLVTLVAMAAESRRANAPSPCVLHSLSRWADVVVRAVECQHDPRTLKEWGRAAGVSTGALRNWCSTARIPARQSLLFARMLRAVVKHSRSATPPEDLLNVVDRRTLVKMLTAAGSSSAALPRDVNEFLCRQRFVKTAAAIRSVAVALHSREFDIQPVTEHLHDQRNAVAGAHHVIQLAGEICT